MRNKIILTTLSSIALAFLLYSPKKSIRPLAFYDVNNDGTKDAIVCYEREELNKTRIKYDLECLMKGNYRFIITNPSQLKDTFTYFGYIDGKNINKTENQYFSRKNPFTLTKRISFPGDFTKKVHTEFIREGITPFLEVTPVHNPKLRVQIPLFIH